MRWKKRLRSSLERRGYHLFKDEYMPYGIKPFTDIRRLAQRHDWRIETFFDIGANIGTTAAEALARFPAARVVCFEPHPVTFARLEAAFATEPRVAAYRTALGREAGEAAFFQYERSEVNSLIADAPYAVRFGTRSETIAVPVATLDGFCAEHGIERIDVLKVDTEGFDSVVLEGARDLLARRAIRFVYTEFNFVLPRTGRSGGALADIDAVLAPAGLRFVASYTDYIVPEGEFFAVCNALFVLSEA